MTCDISPGFGDEIIIRSSPPRTAPAARHPTPARRASWRGVGGLPVARGGRPRRLAGEELVDRAKEEGVASITVSMRYHPLLHVLTQRLGHAA